MAKEEGATGPPEDHQGGALQEEGGVRALKLTYPHFMLGKASIIYLKEFPALTWQKSLMGR